MLLVTGATQYVLQWIQWLFQRKLSFYYNFPRLQGWGQYFPGGPTFSGDGVQLFIPIEPIELVILPGWQTPCPPFWILACTDNKVWRTGNV